MASTKPLIAFYGATGGCTLAALIPALIANYDCTALARTPSKLTTMLLSKGVPQATLTAHLNIIPGDVLDASACAGPLSHNGRTASIIISGIGAYPTLTGPAVTLCGDAVTNILSALKTLNPATKPLLVALSTTGISETGPRDVPLLFVPLYRVVLANLHEDKKRMERVIVQNAESEGSMIRGYVILRPSALTNGKAQGEEKVRVGTEESPSVGYWISREDVGLWMFENLLEGDGGRFVGQKVTVTY